MRGAARRRLEGYRLTLQSLDEYLFASFKVNSMCSIKKWSMLTVN
jgi:hypothetical protein